MSKMLNVNPTYIDSNVLNGNESTTATVPKSLCVNIDDDVMFYSGDCYHGYVTGIDTSSDEYNIIEISVLGILNNESED